MLDIRFIKRERESWTARILVPILSIIMAFVFGWIFLWVNGFDPAPVYWRMYESTLGSFYALSETIVKAIPLMIAGLAVSLSFRMKLWNIGAEGQLYMGAVAASGVALYLDILWGPLLLLTMLLAAFAAGGLWSLVPGALRAFWDVNVTITSLLLNYVAILFVSYLIFGPWKDPQSFGFPITPRFPPHATLPAFFDSRIHLGLAIAIILAVMLYGLLKYTRWGYEVKVIGESPAAARYAGMNVKRQILLVMLISGGIAGIVGMVEVAGITHRLQQGISPGYGYTAIIVAWLARLNPFAIILVAFLFGALLVAGLGIQTFGISFSMVLVIQGAVLFFLLGGDIFVKYRLRIRRKEKDDL